MKRENLRNRSKESVNTSGKWKKDTTTNRNIPAVISNFLFNENKLLKQILKQELAEGM